MVAKTEPLEGVERVIAQIRAEASILVGDRSIDPIGSTILSYCDEAEALLSRLRGQVSQPVDRCVCPDCVGGQVSPSWQAHEKAIQDMRRASEQIDNAADGTAYQLGLVSLALMARKFLRELPPPPQEPR